MTIYPAGEFRKIINFLMINALNQSPQQLKLQQLLPLPQQHQLLPPRQLQQHRQKKRLRKHRRHQAGLQQQRQLQHLTHYQQQDMTKIQQPLP